MVTDMPRVSVYRLRRLAAVYANEPARLEAFEVILNRVGINPDLMTDPDGLVDLLNEARCVEALCASLGDKTFAARVGLAAQGPGTLLSYMVRASATLEEALRLAQRFYAMQDPDTRMVMVAREYDTRIALESSVISSRQFPRHRELLLCGLYARTRQIAGPGLWPLSMELETDDPAHCARIAELAGCDVSGDHVGYTLCMPPGALDYEIPTADRTLLGHLLKHGETELLAKSDALTRLSDRVAALLRKNLPGRLPSGDDVASELGLTRRTLTRRLAAEGTSYKLLAESVRCEVAKHLMADGVSIAQIAFLLDFADQSAFSVAFKRRTGKSPATYRKSH